MNDETTQPKDSDASALDVEAEAGSEEAKTYSDKADGTDVLGFLSRTLKRDFASLEEAGKSLTELNSRVGDRAIAETRKKAELAGTFDALVEGYAEEQGKSVTDAREELLALAQSKKKSSSNTGANAQPESKRLAELELRLDLADLLVTNPEAKHVVDELKDIASVKGVSLQEAFRSSKAIQAAAKALSSSGDKNTKGTVTHPSSRTGVAQPNRKTQESVDAYKKERTHENADRMVRNALGL
jgi:CHASE3 domain sensor protein